MTTTRTLTTELDDCYREAVRQGFGGTREEWGPTQLDLDSIVDALGRKPTMEEWRAAGLGWVGNRHVEGDDA